MHNVPSTLATLPATRHPEKTSDKYMFLDTRRVVDDMKDLGYEVTGFDRANGRTAGAPYGLHQVRFQNPAHQNLSRHEAPTVLFVNSYDGTRRARFVAGLIRFACLNGMITGNLTDDHSFLHMGDYEEALMARMRGIAEETHRTFTKIEDYRDAYIEKALLIEMAAEALAIRFGDDTTLTIDPRSLLMPRRAEDLAPDLYTQWNVVQENILRGGVPGLNKDGDIRLSRPVNQIEKSNRINSELWGLLERTGELV